MESIPLEKLVIQGNKNINDAVAAVFEAIKYDMIGDLLKIPCYIVDLNDSSVFAKLREITGPAVYGYNLDFNGKVVPLVSRVNSSKIFAIDKAFIETDYPVFLFFWGYALLYFYYTLKVEEISVKNDNQNAFIRLGVSFFAEYMAFELYAMEMKKRGLTISVQDLKTVISTIPSFPSHFDQSFTKGLYIANLMSKIAKIRVLKSHGLIPQSENWSELYAERFRNDILGSAFEKFQSLYFNVNDFSEILNEENYESYILPDVPPEPSVADEINYSNLLDKCYSLINEAVHYQTNTNHEKAKDLYREAARVLSLFTKEAYYRYKMDCDQIIHGLLQQSYFFDRDLASIILDWKRKNNIDLS